MRILINHTNHPSQKWDEKQKEYWSEIIDLPFPSIDPKATTEEVDTIAMINFLEIDKIAKEITDKNSNASIFIMLQGEFTYCYLLYQKIRNKFPIAIPTTERKVIEKENGEKISIFEFVRWRFL
ncbi:hypothetical protein V4D30_00800 [Thermodesulfovibrio sp. 3907-1M]|jgi:hypothetical protein|uniref:CRISPR-associated protein n=1 Tax=Thermodesulfovibrio autotrophicus TaxID=3118333 RepID=A0AAU8GWV0_9BACT